MNDRKEVTERCFYCQNQVSPRLLEWDHFPVPQALEGTQVVPACRNCHDLKDRMNLEGWDASAAFGGLMGLWTKATTDERLVLAKLFAITMQGLACFKDLQQGKTPYGWIKQHGTLVPEPDEQAIIAQVKILQDEGWSLSEIGQALKARKADPQRRLF